MLSNKLEFFKSTQVIILGICIAIATIGASYIFSKALISIKQYTNDVISVKGSAEKYITSDHIVWDADFEVKSNILKEGYNKINEQLAFVKDFIKKEGITDDELTVEKVNFTEIKKLDEKGRATNELDYYKLTQSITVSSNDVLKVDRLARKITNLISQGIEITSNRPSYYYSKLAELKLEMLSKASENARKRAEQIASSTNSKIGVMKSANMGVFQITPANSYDVSWSGYNDTSSYKKKIFSVVTAEFSLISK